MPTTSRQEIIDVMVAFLQGIGLKVQAAEMLGGSFLPGLKVDRGVLIYDPAKLKFPGDLLHEAGHLAVKSPSDRSGSADNLGGDPAEEMLAISWSYAAIRHLQLPPEIVFHPDGYRGGSQSLLDNFAAGRFLAVPMLQWLGMAYDETQAKAVGALPFPAMRKWLREAE